MYTTTLSVLRLYRLHFVRLKVLVPRVPMRLVPMRLHRLLALSYDNRTGTRVFYNARDRARTAAAR